MAFIIAFLLIAAIVFIHEAAHAIAGLLLGYEPESMHIGLPLAPVLEFTIQDDLPVTISPWLIGGGVIFHEEDMKEAPFYAKTLMYVSGPAANILTGYVTVISVYGIQLGNAVAKLLVIETVKSIGMLVTGQIPLSSLVGPIGILEFATKEIGADVILGVLFIWLILHFMMGIMNLIPVPGLDGGRILTGMIDSLSNNSERVTKVTTIITAISLFGLIAGIVALTVRDVINLFR